jgi:hypothetical protein
MNLLLTFLTNGREHIFHTLPLVLDNLDRKPNYTILVDDSGDPAFRERLHAELGGLVDRIVYVGDEALGFNQAMKTLWRVAGEYGPDFFLHWEDDFVPLRKIETESMAAVLEPESGLVQMALLRQPWFENEKAHGGVIAAREAVGGVFQRQGADWVEHRDHITLNPAVWPGWVLGEDWPDGSWSESAFGRHLFAMNPVMHRAAYWGDGRTPDVEHVGMRGGFGY